MDKDLIIENLLKKVDLLTQKVEELSLRLEKYERPKKNSNNSSIPPSKDENRPRRTSLRIPSGKKPGGQEGHKGATLEFSQTPDSYEDHIPSYCNCCGNDLTVVPEQFESKYQVIDIPPISATTIEHHLYSKTCSCGKKTIAKPQNKPKAPVSYGSNVSALIAYLHSRQYIPFKRMQEILNSVFNIPISEGGIHCLLNKVANKFTSAYDLIKESLSETHGKFVGADETGVRVNGAKYWAWTWQNNDATFISITSNRGMDSINENFANGFENSILVHDCWRSHFNTKALSHQVCMAHLLRDLNYLSEKYSNKWSELCKEIIQSAIKLKKLQIVDENKYPDLVTSIQDRMDRLLQNSIDDEMKELITFRNRLLKYREYLFVFLYFRDVPSDNNSSERAIRNIKVKMKVSGMFRSASGACNFAIIRSVIDTMIKNKQPILENIAIIANLETD